MPSLSPLLARSARTSFPAILAAISFAACSSGGIPQPATTPSADVSAERGDAAVAPGAEPTGDARAGGEAAHADDAEAARGHAGMEGHAGMDEGEGSVPIFDDLGDHHRGISTEIPEAQTYFDQGMRLQYAFNHAEAIRAYEAALRHDPSCAMCWWGIALAYGPNLNAPMDSASGVLAHQAASRAAELISSATPQERALIEAIGERYGADPTTGRAAHDSAYARAMERVADANPRDPDILTLYAASLMNLSPWNYWTGEYGDRKPRPDTPDILAALERALEIDSNNPGACHYYIHAVEAAQPEKAVECAERLASLMPGAGHIVHMPGHIYIRVGRYADAVAANRHAVHTDETYIADQSPTGIYPLGYYPHNYHFLAFAAAMAGMGETSLDAARKVAPKVSVELATQIYWMQTILVLPQLTRVTFGRWAEILDQPEPTVDLPLAVTLDHYARGVAHAALGHPDAAAAELEEVRRIVDVHGSESAVEGEGGIEVALGIAEHSLLGEIALRSGDAEGAVQHFRAAADLEDDLLYNEPPLWYYPVRHSLGWALLEAGRPADAEKAYRYDLARFPDNGWSLFGLAQALEAQGKDAEAAEVREQFEAAWADADVELTHSRL